MSGFTCWRCQRLLTRGFARGRLDASAARFVWNEVGACEACRQVHERLVQGARLIASNGASTTTPCALELEVFRERVVAPTQPARPRLWILAPVLALALLAIVVPRLMQEDEFVARGTAQPVASVRLFCQSTDGQGVRPADPDCLAGQVLTLGYQSSDPVQLAVYAAGAWTLRPNLPKAQTLAPVDLELAVPAEGLIVLSKDPLDVATLEALRMGTTRAGPNVTVRSFQARLKTP